MQLQQLFGANAYQDSDRLVISKGDLKLTASATNTAESLFAAILLNALNPFEGFIEDESSNFLLDEDGSKIIYNNSSDYINLIITLWKHQYVATKALLIVLDIFLVEVNSEI